MIDADYDQLFDSEFKKLTRGIEDHNFRHFNNSMGIFIYSKEHYKHEMKKRGMIPYDMAERMAEKWDSDHPRGATDKVSPKAMDVIRSLKMTADKNGNLSMGSRTIKALKEIGAIRGVSEHAPTHLQTEGGFN